MARDMIKSESANATAINALLSIMSLIESELDDIRGEYCENDPYNGLKSFYSQLQYGVDDDSLSGYRWILREGIPGSLAQINEQETYMGSKVGDYVIGILNELYKINSELWSRRPEYKILSDWRNCH